MGDLYMLMEDEQLRRLALLLRNQEEPLSRSINSEPDRIKFLRECNDAYDTVITLLENSIQLRNKHEASRAEHGKKADIAKDMQDYVKYGLNLGMQCIQNCGMRVTIVEKMKTHFDELATELNTTDSRDMKDFASLAEEVGFYKNSMWEYVTKLRSPSARAQSKAYSDVLRLQGIDFGTLVTTHKNKLGYKDAFEFLEEDQKLEVYNSIIEESGRAKMPVIFTRKDIPWYKPGGIAALAMTAGIMAWDIFTAEHKLESALNSAVSALSAAVSYAVKVSVTSAVGSVGVKAGTIVLSAAGFVVGALVGILFAAATGAILGVILGTGGKVPQNLDDLKFYSATMPNGMALANQISHS
ncbi:hypothetical protein DCAR_0414746 [Daucus carota subsp. sativus]|uniref:Uncharacterized protein n=1 Tax=Daucus carota subsp. sativus TaxID=79200 RepID=A0A164ZZV4_DAUCS|nr:PREDICTED: uncharacterized protein LOC108216118 [Daucus carota subsp. sativus]WOG95427.1 hypothetical protein DCAR_0414746 [Daucus carota subsp. sativus]